MKENLKKNYYNFFLPIIKENSNTEFILFFPPYSYLTYRVLEEKGVLKNYLEFKKFLKKDLLKYKNVKLYDFQNDSSIIYNLELYKDITHYHQKITSKILDYIKENKFLVTNANK